MNRHAVVRDNDGATIIFLMMLKEVACGSSIARNVTESLIFLFNIFTELEKCKWL